MPTDLTARAFWITGRCQGVLREQTLPNRGPGEVLVRALVGAVSRGTESLVFHGRVPPEEWTRMRAPFQEGSFPWPVKYGYSVVGIVEEGPTELLGRRIFALHPHQDRFVLPLDAVHHVPDSVPDDRAALAASMETAVNALWDATPRLGDRIVVIGAGVIGSCVARLAQSLAGVQVTLVDRNPDRAGLADAFGVSFALPEAAPEDADLVIHASGHPEGLSLALRIAGFEATIVELSWYGTTMVPLRLGDAFHSRRLVLRSSQVSTLSASQRARWTHSRRLALALELLRDPAFDQLITGRSHFRDLPSIMAEVTAPTSPTIVQLVDYS